MCKGEQAHSHCTHTLKVNTQRLPLKVTSSACSHNCLQRNRWTESLTDRKGYTGLQCSATLAYRGTWPSSILHLPRNSEADTATGDPGTMRGRQPGSPCMQRAAGSLHTLRRSCLKLSIPGWRVMLPIPEFAFLEGGMLGPHPGASAPSLP